MRKLLQSFNWKGRFFGWSAVPAVERTPLKFNVGIGQRDLVLIQTHRQPNLNSNQ